jgi:hypothetical protein
MNGIMGSTKTKKKGGLVWYMDGSKTIKALVLGYVDGARGQGTASVLGCTPWYCRLKYVALRLV